MSETLSRSLEDYLEAIHNITARGGGARVKEIADELKVRMPSVTGALRSLSAKGMVEHRPYDTVRLTDSGSRQAQGIVDRHNAVKSFLVDVLGVGAEAAEAEACGIEHAIAPETLDRLVKFVEFIERCGTDQTLKIEDFRATFNSVPDAELVKCTNPHGRMKLTALCPGSHGKVVGLLGKGQIRRLLMDMGITSGVEVEVERVAPLGDPMVIKVRGYLLSLRKCEAELVLVVADSAKRD